MGTLGESDPPLDFNFSLSRRKRRICNNSFFETLHPQKPSARLNPVLPGRSPTGDPAREQKKFSLPLAQRTRVW
jgi:hypothetical protein